MDFTGFQRRKFVRIQNPAARADHAKPEILTARFFEIPAEAVVHA